MIIDSNTVLFDGPVKTEAGKPIALNALQIPGKADPIPINIKFTEAVVGATSIEIKLQEAAAETGGWSDVPGALITVAAADAIPGKRAGWRFLPTATKKQWLRLDVKVTGTATAGKLFAAIVRDDPQPYEAGQYINAGKVVG